MPENFKILVVQKLCEHLRLISGGSFSCSCRARIMSAAFAAKGSPTAEAAEAASERTTTRFTSRHEGKLVGAPIEIPAPAKITRRESRAAARSFGGARASLDWPKRLEVLLRGID